MPPLSFLGRFRVACSWGHCQPFTIHTSIHSFLHMDIDWQIYIARIEQEIFFWRWPTSEKYKMVRFLCAGAGSGYEHTHTHTYIFTNREARDLWMMMMMMWTVLVTADSLGMSWLAFVSTKSRIPLIVYCELCMHVWYIIIYITSRVAKLYQSNHN